MKLKLTEAQFNKLADISADIGLVTLAAIVFPGLFDHFRPGFALVGIIIMLSFWSLSLIMIKE